MNTIPAGRFWHLPSGFVIPMIPKCGSASIYRALLDANRMTHDIHNVGKICMPRPRHENKPALVAIRGAVDRFRSAVCQVNRGSASISVDEILDGLENGTYNNYHFKPQSEILEICKGCESVTFYQFPEEFDKMLMDGGMDPCGEIRNKSNNKPELTTEQRERVRSLYTKDIELRDTLDDFKC